MNEFLAELYDTRATIGATEDNSDVEKLAEARVLDEILKTEGIDVDQLDDGTILKLAHEIFGDNSELVKSAMEGGEENPFEKKDEKKKKEEEKKKDEEESIEEKTAEADMLGRVMAHSMVQELNKIETEKRAAAEPTLVEDKIRKLAAQTKKASQEVTPEKGSALDTLAEKRALAILKEAGIEPEPVQDPVEVKLASAIEKRAWEMLAEAGYTQAEE